MSTSQARSNRRDFTARRQTTIDVDIKLVPDHDAVLRAIPALKESMHLNIELAAPDDFIPVRDGWADRSPFIDAGGATLFSPLRLRRHRRLAKIERGHTQDLADVREMLARGLVTVERLRDEFRAIEPQLYRYPAVDPAAFARAVATITEG